MSSIGHNGGPALDAGRGGWIAISRDMRGHWLVGFGKTVDAADPERGFVLSRAEAWIDLLMECRYESGFVSNAGHKMEIRPGQLLGAVSWLASRWNWTPKTVRGFLDKLENDGMIERVTPGTETGAQKGKQSTIVSVCNFSAYQLINVPEGQASGHAEGEQGASKGHAEGNIYKENKGTREQGNKRGELPLPIPAVAETPAQQAIKVQTQIAFDAWNGLAARVGLAKAKLLTDPRRRAIRLRLAEYGTEGWDQALAAIERSAFLRGRNHRSWRIDLDWLIVPGNFSKVIDGRYGNGAHAAPSLPPTPEQTDARREHDDELAALREEAMRC